MTTRYDIDEDTKIRLFREIFDLIDALRESQEEISALKAHLWIEHLINEILNRKTQKDWSRRVYGGEFGYLNKVRIAVAFGVINRDLMEPLQHLGELRNDLVHKFGHKMSVSDQKKFYSTISVRVMDRASAFIHALVEENLEVIFEDRYYDDKNVERLNVSGRPALDSSLVEAVELLALELRLVLAILDGDVRLLTEREPDED